MKFELRIWTREQAYIEENLGNYREGQLMIGKIQKEGHYSRMDDGVWTRIPYHAIEKFDIQKED